MTLRELLKQNELRVVEVAAGADGLARTISGTVMFDNPEMVNWMRAGEIMLTTGYFLLDDPVKQEKVLRDLADSGSGGLVIKMKRYFHEIPPAMLQLADELHFPLMRIPYHTSLSEISEAVSKYVYGINEEQALQMVYQAMFDVLQGHAEVEYLLKKCGPLLHVPLLYMTPSRKIQCVSQMLHPGLREELAVGQVLFSVPGARQGGRKTADSRSVRRDLSLTAGGQVRAHLSHPLRAGDHGVSGRDPPRQCAADRE